MFNFSARKKFLFNMNQRYFSKSSFKTDLSTLLGVGQNCKPFERRETSALKSLRLDKFLIFLDTKKLFNLPFEFTSAT